MKKLLTLTLVLLGTLATMPAFAQDYDYKFIIVNRTNADDALLPMTLTGLYLSRADEADWGENILDASPNPETGLPELVPGYQMTFYRTIDDCIDDNFDYILYDIKLVDEWGDECFIFGQNICDDVNDDDGDPNTIKIILTEETLLECQGY